MDAYLFYSEYKKMISEERFFEEYHNNTDFTAVVIPEIRNVLNRLDSSIDTSKEYFKIDVSGWKSYSVAQTQDNKTKLKPYVWDLLVAVEHENACELWMDELIKLMHIRCPLKVVIGYNYSDCRDEIDGNDNSDVKKLEFATECMKKVKAYEANKEEQLLVILGNCAPRIKANEYTTFDYRGYVFNYDEGKFVKIGKCDVGSD